MKSKYWIQIEKSVVFGFWFWRVKCINGTTKCASHGYSKLSYCVNDAKIFSKVTGLEIRRK